MHHALSRMCALSARPKLKLKGVVVVVIPGGGGVMGVSCKLKDGAGGWKPGPVVGRKLGGGAHAGLVADGATYTGGVKDLFVPPVLRVKQLDT